MRTTRIVAAGLLLLLLPSLPGRSSGAGELTPGEQCDVAIRAAERDAAIPQRLLGAIGVVESGRRDPSLRLVRPWPWTIDAAGQSWSLDSKAAAIAQVQALQAHGVESIDVGCMQVNLMYHPRAFATLEQAFDPAANAAYAARFLDALHARDADWRSAAGHYHSGTPALAQEYERKVFAVWGAEALRPAESAGFAATWPAAPITLLPVLARPVGSRRVLALPIAFADPPLPPSPARPRAGRAAPAARAAPVARAASAGRSIGDLSSDAVKVSGPVPIATMPVAAR